MTLLARLVLSLLSIVWLTLSTSAQEPDVAFDSKANYAILIDAKSGAVFYEKNADVAVPPASMTKLMTQAVVFDALKAGKLTNEQEMLVSEDAWRRGGSPAGGSTMYAELNSRIKVIDLLRGAVIQSANDACIVLAEGISGSESAFMALLDAKAKELGMKNSTFRNSTGLPDPEHKMSVRDLSTVARYIIQNHPDYFKLYGEPEFEWNKIKQSNRNPLLKDFPGADGMKTGYTREAGYGLVGTAMRDGRRLIMVVAGMETPSARKEESQKLLEFGFRQFKPIDVFEAGETVATARVWGGEQRWVDLVTVEAFKIALSAKEQDTVEVKLNYTGPLMAPVEKGARIGTVRILVDGKTVAETPVVTSDAVAPITSMWTKAFDSVLIMVFGS